MTSVADNGIRGRAGSLLSYLRTEAARWLVVPALAEALFVLPFVGAVAIILLRADSGAYRFVTNEDSVLEWPQFFGFAAASLLACLCAWRLHRAGRLVLAAAYLAFGIGCFVVMGEEIAWGQRIIGYGNPERLEEINERKETTVHNIDLVQHFTNVAYLIAGLYGSIGAWIVRGKGFWRRSRLVDFLLPDLPDHGLFRHVRLQRSSICVLSGIGVHRRASGRMGRVLPGPRLLCLRVSPVEAPGPHPHRRAMSRWPPSPPSGPPPRP